MANGSLQKKSLLPALILGLILVGPYLIQLMATPYYVPGPDEAYQIQGAHQLALGNGYVSANNADISDLGKPSLSWITGWPIAYPAILVGLHKLGMGILGAAKAFQFLVVLAGVFAWALLLHRLCVGLRTQALFLCLLWVHFFTWGIYSTNAFSWALMPLLFFCAAEMGVKKWGALGAGLVAGLLILFRYQNVILIPAGILAILVLSYREAWLVMARRLMAFALFPALCFAAIYGLNRRQSGQGTFLASLPVDFTWRTRWIFDASNAFIFNASFRLDEILGKALQALGAMGAFTPLKYALSFSLLVAFGCLIGKFRSPIPGRERNILVWLLAYLAGLFGMLFSLAIVLNVENIPIGRYYHSIFPVFLLLTVFAARRAWLKCGPSLGLVIGRPVFAIIFLACLAMNTAYARYRHRLASDFALRSAAAERAVAKARETSSSAHTLVFADQLFPYFISRPDLTVVLYPDALRKGEPAASRDTLVFLYHDSSNPKPQYPPIADIAEIAKIRGLKADHDEFGEFAWRTFKGARE